MWQSGFDEVHTEEPVIIWTEGNAEIMEQYWTARKGTAVFKFPVYIAGVGERKVMHGMYVTLAEAITGARSAKHFKK